MAVPIDKDLAALLDRYVCVRIVQMWSTDLSRFEFPGLLGSCPGDAAGVDSIRFDGDPHWNAHGHALAAGAIAETLRDQGLVEGWE